MNRKLIVISADAMISEDLDLLKYKPVFGRLIREGAVVKHVRSIYPTLTYPCHTTMRTGNHPDRTGVWNNLPFLIRDDEMIWNFYQDAVRCRDLFDAAKEKHLTTAAVAWPVTGNHKNIDYLVDEIWPSDPAKLHDEDAFTKAYLDSGTSQELFDTCVKPHISLRLPKRQPDTAWFSTYVSADIIRNYKPDLMMIHIANIDGARHKAGVFSEEAMQSVLMTEDMIDVIISAAEEAGVWEETDLVIPSDHGQIDVDRAVRPNVLLRQEGFMTCDADGAILSWKAWCLSAGASAQIAVNPDLDEAEKKQVLDQVRTIIEEKITAGDSGIERMYTVDETEAAEKLAGAFDLVLETDGHTKFLSGWSGDYMTVFEKPVGTHGHYPDKGPDPVFIGYGPSFVKGARVECARLADTAATYAAILGLDLPGIDGKVIGGILGCRKERRDEI